MASAWPTSDSIEAELDELYGPFRARHHARYHEPGMPYHIIVRTFQGMALLTPTDEFRKMFAGIIGRALTTYKTIQVFALGFLSNHGHTMLAGTPEQIPAFVGYIKRELTLRYGPTIDWEDTMWRDGYVSTALPTPESQVRCLQYILSQGSPAKLEYHLD
jgi:REP element-mobilizing transposase RayT